MLTRRKSCLETTRLLILWKNKITLVWKHKYISTEHGTLKQWNALCTKKSNYLHLSNSDSPPQKREKHQRTFRERKGHSPYLITLPWITFWYYECYTSTWVAGLNPHTVSFDEVSFYWLKWYVPILCSVSNPLRFFSKNGGRCARGAFLMAAESWRIQLNLAFRVK